MAITDLPKEELGEVVDLLQHFIRARCVNDGTVGSGGEERAAGIVRSYLEGSGADIETFSAAPGRTSLLARIEGTDPAAPSLLLMGHTDVVPVTPERWSRDPFSGEVVDGFVWGRGAIDMLNQTASMAVAFKRLAVSGFRPEGTLLYLAIADEEAGGAYGSEWLVRNHLDEVRASYAITESGGFPLETPAGIQLPVTVAEKGAVWCRLIVRGTPGHASTSYRTDNALVKAAEVIRRLATWVPPRILDDTYRRMVTQLGYDDELTSQLLDGDRIDDGLEALGEAWGREFDGLTRMTVTPTVVHGGVKSNVIPDSVEISLDIRTLPQHSAEVVESTLRDILGELWADVDLVLDTVTEASASATDTPLWDILEDLSRDVYPDAPLLPVMTVGGTDATPFRRAGVPTYGYDLFSRRLGFAEYARMFHGDDERVDLDSLALSVQLWQALSRRLLGGGVR